MSLRLPLLVGVLLFAWPAAPGGFPAPHWVPGPVADFGPHRSIATHSELEGVGGPLSEALTRVLGNAHVIDDFVPEDAGDEAGTLIWMRDFQPLYVRGADGQLKALLYLSEHPVRREFLPFFDGSIFLPGPDGAFDERVPADILPLIHQNGNLVSTGERILFSSTLFSENAIELDDPDLLELGYEPRDREAVLQLLERSLGRDRKDFIVLPPLPGEGTGHVDVFVLALGPMRVMVPRIDPALVEAIDDLDERRLGLEALLFLEGVASTVRGEGLDVVRLPMLPPRIVLDPEEEKGYDIVYLSPANSVTFDDGKSPRRLFLPTFKAGKVLKETESAQQRAYEKRWEETLTEAGWAVEPVDATRLAPLLGLLRCVSAPVPVASLLPQQAPTSRSSTLAPAAAH